MRALVRCLPLCRAHPPAQLIHHDGSPQSGWRRAWRPSSRDSKGPRCSRPPNPGTERIDCRWSNGLCVQRRGMSRHADADGRDWQHAGGACGVVVSPHAGAAGCRVDVDLDTPVRASARHATARPRVTPCCGARARVCFRGAAETPAGASARTARTASHPPGGRAGGPGNSRAGPRPCLPH